mgnify:CR=1 FL=1
MEDRCKEKILSEDYWDFIIPLYRDEELKEVNPENACIQEMDFGYKSVSVDRRILLPLSFREYWYSTIPKCYTLLDMQPLDAAGIITLQNYPTLQLMGEGIMIGFLDTGIDYTHPVFRNLDGTTRIAGIWDQTIQDGDPPEGFLYGTEYTEERINAALHSESPQELISSEDTDGHGTFVASVAAGSAESSGQFLGAAPEAVIAMVKLKPAKKYLKEFFAVAEDAHCYQENDIMLGIKYAESFVQLFERPVVICLGLGTNQGDHAGSSALSRYLSSLAVRRSRAAIVCGGNEGNASHHYHGMLSSQTPEGTARDVEIRVSEGCIGFWLELWGALPDAFNLSIRTPGGENIPELRLGLQQSVTYSFIYEKSRVTIDSALVEENSGEELILVRIQDPTPGIWTFRVSASGSLYNGNFHMWLPITEFLSTPVYFLNPDPDMTLTEPSMAPEVLSVSTYNAENNSFYAESGRGFGRTGQIRPDLSAPGVNISTIDGRRTGSSMAAAITAGAVAQFFQWSVIEGNNRLAESREIRSYFIRGAVRTQGLNYPNREWGYGRLNLEETFNALLRV